MEKIEVVWKPLADLIPYENNAKKHPPEQVRQIANSIERFGWRSAIAVDGDNVIVNGHGRYMAAQILGLDKVPTWDCSDLSEEEIKALRLADNKVAESEWDFGKLELEIEDLGEAIDLTDFGFEEYSYIDDLMENEFTSSGNELDRFAMTFYFPKTMQEEIENFVSTTGKEGAANLFVEAMRNA